MKEIIKEGQKKRIIPKTGGGLTGEVHLLIHGKKKYILRMCKNLETAKNYVKIYKKFEKHKFLPKLIGRYGNDVVFEYIKGRHLRKNDLMKVYEKIGRIAGQINKYRVKGDVSKIFRNQLKELVTGRYSKNNQKVNMRKKLSGVSPESIKVFSEKESKDLMNVYRLLEKHCSPSLAYDINDVTPENFLVDNNGKVWFVDIDSIKPKVRGIGISKSFLQLTKKENQQKAFLRGYSSASSIKFLTEKYLDFLNLNYLMQKINYRFKIYKKNEYEVYIKKIKKIVNKYKNEK